MRYRAVIFDLFGTLIDNFSSSGYDDLLAQMAGELNAPVETFTRLWHCTFPERAIGALATTGENIIRVCGQLALRPTDTQVLAAVAMRVEYTRCSLAPRKEALETIAELWRKGLKVGLISDCSSEVPLLWGQTPFAGLFDEAIFSCQVRMKKPDPRIYLLACSKLQVEPGECLYVGDGSSHELTGAERVGMTPLLIRAEDEARADAHRIDEDDWQGPAIRTLSEVLPYALAI